MRLTLRTLLAYMDDILDPADHEDLGRKIEASDFATELIHRSRDASRRLRLGAPELLASDGGDLHGGDELDANTMAEYLDNTLAPEAVAEFERACLASGDQGDMLLAEAVSSHHVLTLVLGEPAEVDPDLRRRLYRLGEGLSKPGQTLRIEPAHVPADADAPPEPAPLPAPQPVAPVEVAAAAPIAPAPSDRAAPDYLRVAAAEERRRKRKLMYAAVGFMALGAFAVWAWPTTQVPPTEVAQLDPNAGGDLEVVPIESADIGAAGAAAVPGGEAPPFESPAAEGDLAEAPRFVPDAPAAPEGEGTGATDQDAAALLDDVEPVTGVDPSDTMPSFDEPVEDDVMTAPAAGHQPLLADDSAPAVDLDDMPRIPLGPLPEVGPTDDGPGIDLEEPVAEDPTTMTSGSSTLPRLDDERPAAPAVADSTPAEGGAAPPLADAASDAAAGSPADPPAGPGPLGTYLGMMGASDMLLGYNPVAEQWQRLLPSTPLADNAQLLTLPTFRTMVNLRGANVYLPGGTEATLLSGGSQSGGPATDFAIDMPRGRLIIHAGLNGNRIELIVSGESHLIVLEASATLAIEVRGRFVPGFDPAADGGRRTISWYLTTGSGQMVDVAGDRPLAAPMQWTSTPGDPALGRVAEDLPAWINQEQMSNVQRSAQRFVAPALKPGAPVKIALLELSDAGGLGRRREVRTLAAESAAYVDIFEPMIKALGDADQYAYWKRLIATMRQALAEDPNAAAALEDALVALRGQRDARQMLDMILGFGPAQIGGSAEEIQAGPVAGVLRNLEHEDLDFRVLAFQNLCELTGTAGFGYRPEQTADQRQRKVRVIWNRFNQGELLPEQSDR